MIIFNICFLNYCLLHTIYCLLLQSTYIFLLLCRNFLLYLFIDILYFFFDCLPLKVSKKEIIFHHLITILLIIISFAHPYELKNITCITLLVEFNTLCVILKRYKIPFTNFLFYITWIVQRLLMFPILSYFYINSCYYLENYFYEYYLSILGSVLITLYSYIQTIKLVKRF